MEIQKYFLTALSFLAFLGVVVFVVFIGWYLVWKLFLSRFRLVREILGAIDSPTNTDTKGRTKTKRLRKD
uniref:Protein with signal anchor n=1 Tax=Nyssomyia neivai TaxID=330878 RepID=A0A1L8DVD5_9DIPT